MKAAEPALVTLGPLDLTREQLLTVTAWATISLILMYVSAPPIAPGALVACLVPPLIWCWVDGAPLRLVEPGASSGKGLLAALCVFAYVAWMFVSNFWSPNPSLGIASAAWCLSVLLLTFAVTTLAARVAPDVRRRISAAVVLAFSLGLALLLFEAVTDMALRRMVMSVMPFLRSATQGTIVDGGWVKALPFFLIKKNVAVVMMMAWPALLLAVRLARTERHRQYIRAGVAVFILTVLLAGHDTSKVALGASAAVWMLTVLDHRLARRTVLILWLMATIAVVPLALLAYKADLHKTSGIQFSGRHRIVIWGQTAENVLKHPVIGAGLSATRYIDENSRQARFVPGTDIIEGTNVHSHNVFLQTWHELGGIGALLLFVAGLPLISGIGRKRTLDQPYLYATFTTVAAMASLSWSLVAVWFTATFGIAVILAQLASNFADDAALPHA